MKTSGSELGWRPASAEPLPHCRDTRPSPDHGRPPRIVAGVSAALFLLGAFLICLVTERLGRVLVVGALGCPRLRHRSTPSSDSRAGSQASRWPIQGITHSLEIAELTAQELGHLRRSAVHTQMSGGNQPGRPGLVLAQVPKGSAEMVAAAIRTVFAQPDAAHVHEQPDVIAGMPGRQFPTSRSGRMRPPPSCWPSPPSRPRTGRRSGPPTLGAA
jgi:hypothetical protein